jgi:two-component system, chemotaxis family, response regulator Rcp1
MIGQDQKSHQMEILLIEDNLADACSTIVALKEGKIQHRLTLIRDGVEAMEFLYQEGKFARAPQPDLILLDLDLPYKDGREVLKEIKADFNLQKIAVVIMTASRDDQDRLQSELLHVDSFITKPIDLEKFLSLVKHLRRKSLLQDVILPMAE